MNTISAIQRPDTTIAADRLLRPLDGGDGSFRRTLETVAGNDQATGPLAPKAATELRTAATALVASAFIVPVLQSLREQPILEGGVFAPGMAERRFGPLLDQQIADRLTAGAGLPLIDTIVDHMTRLQVEAADGTT